MLGLVSAQLIGLFIEAILYGIYLVTCGACIVPGTFQPRPGHLRLPFWRLRWPIALVTLLLFVISTLNLALGLVRVLAPRVQRGPLPRDWLTVTKVCL